MPRLTESELLIKYHDIFNLVTKNPRITPREIARETKYSGQGKTRSTIAYHLRNMYEKEISLHPRLRSLPFSNMKRYAYFCRKEDRKNIYETFLHLHSRKDVLFVQCLSGSDFFITSHRNDIDFGIDSFIIEEKSTFYRSIYTIPLGWKKKEEKCLESLLGVEYSKGKLERKTYGFLNWPKSVWKVYHFMRKNVRCRFTAAGKYAGIDSKTAKKYFYDNIVPKCDIVHFFFPKGRNTYREVFLKLTTDYEVSLIKALERLPCTSYIYPLDSSLIIVLFQQNEKSVFFVLQKLKEIGIINDYLFHTPIIHGTKE